MKGETPVTKGDWDCLAPIHAGKLPGHVFPLDCCHQCPADNYIHIYKICPCNVAVLFCSYFNSRKVSGFLNGRLWACFLSSCGDSQQVNADGPMVKGWHVWVNKSSVLWGMSVKAGKLSGCFPAHSRGICSQHASKGCPVPLRQKQMEHGSSWKLAGILIQEVPWGSPLVWDVRAAANRPGRFTSWTLCFTCC